MRFAAAVLCLLAVSACDEHLTGPTVPLDSEFTLAPGEARAVEGASLLVRFEGVSGDSRCPADAFCIQGGSADVRLTAVGDGATREYVIRTGDMRPVQHHDLTIALVQLAPYPFSSRTIAPEEYRATLKVTR
jgi:hypothetical protein